MGSKWLQRKFMLTIVAVIYSIIASLGLNAPIEQIAVTDLVIAVWVIIEGWNDNTRIKANK